jgi:hypothetical protein
VGYTAVRIDPIGGVKHSAVDLANLPGQVVHDHRPGDPFRDPSIVVDEPQ